MIDAIKAHVVVQVSSSELLAEIEQLRIERDKLRQQVEESARLNLAVMKESEHFFKEKERLRSLILDRIAGPPVAADTTHANVLAWDREWLERAKELANDA